MAREGVAFVAAAAVVVGLGINVDAEFVGAAVEGWGVSWRGARRLSFAGP